MAAGVVKLLRSLPTYGFSHLCRITMLYVKYVLEKRFVVIDSSVD